MSDEIMTFDEWKEENAKWAGNSSQMRARLVNEYGEYVQKMRRGKRELAPAYTRRQIQRVIDSTTTREELLAGLWELGFIE